MYNVPIYGDWILCPTVPKCDEENTRLVRFKSSDSLYCSCVPSDPRWDGNCWNGKHIPGGPPCSNGLNNGEKELTSSEEEVYQAGGRRNYVVRTSINGSQETDD